MAIPNLLDPCGTGVSMGLSLGTQPTLFRPRKKNRWMFQIPKICADATPALPPRKSARPSISLKEFEFHHVNETIWYPMRPEWKPIQVTLFDSASKPNPVFSWLQDIYDPTNTNNKFTYPTDIKIQTATLQLYDGCGCILESWIYQNVYPSEINWGELSMDEDDFVTVDFTLRYDRAYILDSNGNTTTRSSIAAL